MRPALLRRLRTQLQIIAQSGGLGGKLAKMRTVSIGDIPFIEHSIGFFTTENTEGTKVFLHGGVLMSP